MPNSDSEDIDLDKVSLPTLKAYVKSTLEAPGRRWSPQLEQLRKEGMKPEPVSVWQRNNLIAEIVLGYFNAHNPSERNPTLFDGWSIEERKRLNELCRTPTHGGIVPNQESAEERDKLLRIQQRLEKLRLGFAGYYSMNQYLLGCKEALANIWEIVRGEPFNFKPPSQERNQFEQLAAWENTAYRILKEELRTSYQGLTPETLLEKIREHVSGSSALAAKVTHYEEMKADLHLQKEKVAEWAMCARAVFDAMGIPDPILQPHALRLKTIEVLRRQKFDLQQWSEAAKSVAAFLKIEPGETFMPSQMRNWLVDYFNQHQPDEILEKLKKAEIDLLSWRSFALNLLQEMNLTYEDAVLIPLKVGNLVLPWVNTAKKCLRER